LDPAEAVSLVLSYVTAYQMLRRVARVQSGERILIHGAGGAVGTAMLQLGSTLDLEMYGTASKPKHDLVSSLGAVPIDYQNQDFVAEIAAKTERGVAAVFDHLGGEHFNRSFQSLRAGGSLVAYGFYNTIMGQGGSVPLDFLRLKMWNLLPNRRSTHFYSIGPWRKQHADWFYQDLSHLFELLADGKIEPVIWKRISLTEVAQAHDWIEQAVPRGKVVITMDHV
jgi:NADPH:quinone reductase-like Zn-dependent oxidoreductase